MLHEESRAFLPIPALDMAEEGIEELVRRIIRSTQEGVNTSRANVASNVSTPDELYKSRRNTVTMQTSHQKTQSPARKKTVNKDDNVNELAEELKTKISEVHVLLEQMRSQVCANKQSEPYSGLLSDFLEVRGKGKANRRDNKAAKNCKRKERRKIKDKKRFCNAIESRKQYVKNLSNEQLTDKQITLLSRGLKFIPTPVTKENLIRRQLVADFNQFARRMRLQYIFYGEENEPHPFHVKSD